ncbi:hypothetical protein HaLaN_08695 [Haematococcus lacustris]|uniref:Uncharacterized protein n=1 Tax=Haematococcus lacustris TaxID=44745 RepID=A0A699Z1L5_HAELA|nr:hypothetical protein HaLaN_08695 [Haematococcus lacustris]
MCLSLCASAADCQGCQGTLQLSCHRSPPGPGLWGSRLQRQRHHGQQDVPVKQMQREACKQFPGRVVLVHEFRTSRVSSARTNVVQGQAESFRPVPVPGAQHGDAVPDPGSMCSTSNVIKRRFYDRDVSAALNIRRIAAGPGRPRELSSRLGRPAMPNPGTVGQGRAGDRSLPYRVPFPEPISLSYQCDRILSSFDTLLHFTSPAYKVTSDTTAETLTAPTQNIDRADAGICEQLVAQATRACTCGSCPSHARGSERVRAAKLVNDAPEQSSSNAQ